MISKLRRKRVPRGTPFLGPPPTRRQRYPIAQKVITGLLMLLALGNTNLVWANAPPIFISGSASPTTINVDETIHFESVWHDPEDDFVVGARVKYCHQNTSNCATESLDYIEGTEHPRVGAEIQIPITEAGTYNYQFFAVDAEPLDNPLHFDEELDWYDGGTFTVVDNSTTPDIPVTPPPSQGTTNSINIPELISAGHDDTCSIKTDGSVVCWGDDIWDKYSPPSGTFTQISQTFSHTCGIKTDGSVVCWGSDYFGQSIPPSGKFAQVSAGTYHTCGIKTNSTVVCWGSDGEGRASPPNETFIQVVAGGAYSCGIKTDGNVTCWGRINLASSPPSGTFTQISIGSNHTCGIKTEGSVVCWGNDYSGQSSPPNGNFMQISAGKSHTCGIKTEGSVVCWGDNGQGKASPPSGIFTQVSAGDFHTCGIKTDGSIACWGSDSDGQSSPPANLVALAIALPENENSDVTGYTVSGTVSLPSGDIAPKGGIGIDFNVEIYDENNDYSESGSYDSVHIPENQSSASFTLLIPDEPNIKWTLQIDCSYWEWDETLGEFVQNGKCDGYVPNLWYSTSGMTMFDTDKTIFQGGQNYPNVNLVLPRGTSISGSISFPQGKVAPNGGLEIWIDAIEPDNFNNGFLDERVIIPEGESSVPYTITVIDDTQAKFIIGYWCESCEEYQQHAYYSPTATTTDFPTNLLQGGQNHSNINLTLLPTDAPTDGTDDTEIPTDDTQPPTVTISSHPSTVSGEESISISGTASDNTVKITWQNNQGDEGEATMITKDDAIAWTLDNIPLKIGENIITITAYDDAGLQSSEEITITVPEPDFNISAVYPNTGTYNRNERVLTVWWTTTDTSHSANVKIFLYNENQEILSESTPDDEQETFIIPSDIEAGNKLVCISSVPMMAKNGKCASGYITIEDGGIKND